MTKRLTVEMVKDMPVRVLYGGEEIAVMNGETFEQRLLEVESAIKRFGEESA